MIGGLILVNRIINITISSGIASRVIGTHAYVGEHNTTQIKFTFDSEWDGLLKRVIFESPNKVTLNPILLDSDDSILIPSDALDRYGVLLVSVIGTANERKTKTCILQINVGDALSDIGTQPSEYTDFISDINERVTNMQTRMDNGEFIGKDAYMIAVENGFAGTREEFGIYVSTIKSNYDTIQQTMSDLLSMLGVDICNLVDGMVPVDKIPLSIAHHIEEITDVSQLVTLTTEQVQKNDIAAIIEGTGDNRKRTISYQLLGNGDPSVRSNWVEVATDHANTAAYSTTSGTAENATKINGHRLVEMTQAEYDVAVKDPDTYYLVY